MYVEIAEKIKNGKEVSMNILERNQGNKYISAIIDGNTYTLGYDTKVMDVEFVYRQINRYYI